MAGNYEGPGHKIVSGEEPSVGLRIFTNEYKWGVITKVGNGKYNHETREYDHMDTVPCGYYCEAWHDIKYDDGTTITMNCDRLTTREPR